MQKSRRRRRLFRSIRRARKLNGSSSCGRSFFRRSCDRRSFCRRSCGHHCSYGRCSFFRPNSYGRCSFSRQNSCGHRSCVRLSSLLPLVSLHDEVILSPTPWWNRRVPHRVLTGPRVTKKLAATTSRSAFATRREYRMQEMCVQYGRVLNRSHCSRRLTKTARLSQVINPFSERHRTSQE